MKISGELSASWLIISIPMMIVQTVWSGHLISVASLDFRGDYNLSPKQRMSLTLYLVSFLLCLVAELLTCIMGRYSGFVPSLLWTFAVPLFMISGVIIMREEANLMASSRGYTDPQPLSRTYEGWGLSLGSFTVSLLLGTIIGSSTLPAYDRKASDHDKDIEGYQGIGDVLTCTEVDRGLNRGSTSITSTVNEVFDGRRKASGQFSDLI